MVKVLCLKLDIVELNGGKAALLAVSADRGVNQFKAATARLLPYGPDALGLGLRLTSALHMLFYEPSCEEEPSRYSQPDADRRHELSRDGGSDLPFGIARLGYTQECRQVSLGHVRPLAVVRQPPLDGALEFVRGGFLSHREIMSTGPP